MKLPLNNTFIKIKHEAMSVWLVEGQESFRDAFLAKFITSPTSSVSLRHQSPLCAAKSQ